MRTISVALILLCALTACTATNSSGVTVNPTAADAQKFIAEVNETMEKLATASSQASWVAENFITDDTEAINARENQRFIDAIAKYAKEAVKYDKVEVPADVRRQLTLLKNSLTMATPSDPKEGEELTKIAASLDATYGKGKWCQENPGKPETCLNIDDITKTMADTKTDEKRLRQVWEGWQTIAQPMRKDYTRFVELS